MIFSFSECKALTIEWHSHHQLLLGSSRLNPVVHCKVLGGEKSVLEFLNVWTYSVEEVEIIIRVLIHGSHMTSFLVPLTMVI